MSQVFIHTHIHTQCQRSFGLFICLATDLLVLLVLARDLLSVYF